VLFDFTELSLNMIHHLSGQHGKEKKEKKMKKEKEKKK
jgi:hypothetical protein